jgi:hypothetical protein
MSRRAAPPRRRVAPRRAPASLLAALAAALLLACAQRCACDAGDAGAAAAAGSESPACLELGFTGLALCSDCDALEAIVHDEGALRAAPHAKRVHAHTLSAPRF